MPHDKDRVHEIFQYLTKHGSKKRRPKRHETTLRIHDLCSIMLYLLTTNILSMFCRV